MSLVSARLANASFVNTGLASAGLATAGVLDDLRGLAAPKPDDSLGDLRFRALLSDDDWASLPLPIRRRFSKRLAGGRTVVYAGEVVETRMSAVGWCFAQVGRLVGGPLPLSREAKVPSVVTVTEDMATGGQIWTRLYARRRGFPQIIHSAKRFAGPTGIEEYLGRGFSMELQIGVRCGALVFRSERYFFTAFGRRFGLPGWLSPGTMTVTHAECGDGRFEFALEVEHPRFGLLIRQLGIFRERVR
jgi:Domain of unknown function (DUF4166)